MRVATWNAQHGRPNPDGPPDIGRAVAPLRALSADVVAIQELDRGRRRSRRVDQPRILADGLDAELVWAPALERGGQYGIALVVRGTLLRSEVVGLPGRGEPRVAAITEVQVAHGRWTVACTHLSTRRADAVRQLVTIFDALAAWPFPRVILGDLNLADSAVLPWSAAEGYQLVAGPPTFSTRQATVDARIDHILVRAATVRSAWTKDLGTSDHRAVVADLEAGAGRDPAQPDYRSSSSPLA
jgi:endonuclease/exonuclease/phosphatase family metal-dependent hydrolase